MAKSLVLAGLIAAIVLLDAAPGFTDGSITDLWDVSRGTVVTSDSGTASASSSNDVFGASDSTVEPGSTIFRDDQTAGFIHFVEWRTTAPVTVNAFTLLANDDVAPNGDRGFSQFRLFALNPTTLLASFTPSSNPYPDGGIVVIQTITPVTAQDFRAEFVQFAGTGSARGPRIRELDGFNARVFGGDDTGFIPSDKATAKCENAVASQLAKLAGKSAGCLRKAAKQAFKGKPFDLDDCDDEVEDKFYDAIFKLKNCPACVQVAAFGEELHAVATDPIDSGAATTYCAGTTPLDPEEPVFFVPPDKATAKCADGVAKSHAKLIAAVLKCHLNAAKKAFANKPFDEEACEDKARQKYDAAHAKRKGCPACLDAVTLADNARSDLDNQNGFIYCGF